MKELTNFFSKIKFEEVLRKQNFYHHAQKIFQTFDYQGKLTEDVAQGTTTGSEHLEIITHKKTRKYDKTTQSNDEASTILPSSIAIDKNVLKTPDNLLFCRRLNILIVFVAIGLQY